MKKAFVLFTTTCLFLSACKKNDVPPTPAPEASFSLATSYADNDTSQVISMATYDGFWANNNSKNSENYFWDFGNGLTSTEKKPSVSYAKSGTYTLTLTSSTKDGRKSVTSKTIKVLDRVAKQIVIRSLTPKSALGWSTTYSGSDKLNVWIEILQGAPNQNYPLSSYGIPQAPLVYKTSIASNVDASQIPYTFTIPDKLIVDYPAISQCCGYAGIGYIYNVYGQDNTGTYLLMSSHGSGIGFSMSGDIRFNRFEIATGFNGTNLSLKGDYE